MMQGTDPEDVIKNAFGCFDEDNVGLLHEDRLRELLTTIGDRFTDDEVRLVTCNNVLVMRPVTRDLERSGPGCVTVLVCPSITHSHHQTPDTGILLSTREGNISCCRLTRCIERLRSRMACLTTTSSPRFSSTEPRRRTSLEQSL